VDLKDLKVAYADVSIALEIAQARYNDIREQLVEALNKKSEDKKD
jgi:hypothetical protein